MAKFYFLIALIVLCFEGNSQIIVIPDANFKAKLLEADVSNNIAFDEMGNGTKIDVNGDNEIQVSEALLVYDLDVSNSNIFSLEGVENFLNIRQLKFGNNSISSFDTSVFSNLTLFDCSNNNLTSLDLTSNLELQSLYCNNNLISEINLPNFTYGIYANLSNNQLNSIDLSNLSQIDGLNLSNNHLTSIDFNNPNYVYIFDSILNFSNNPLVHLNLSQLRNTPLLIGEPFDTITIENTLLTSIVCPSAYVKYYNISNNQNLEFISFKNNLLENFVENDFDTGLVITNNPVLTTICVDNDEYEYFLNTFPDIQITTYCSFTPGGNYKTVTGNVKLDLNGNGCDANDIPSMMLPVNLYADSNFIGSSFTNNNGNFTSYFTQGYSLWSIVPQFENPYFSVSPSNYDYNYTTANNTETVNFCISPNGVHPDLEASIFSTTPARPGFDANYKLIIKNKGTETQSGTIGLNFDDTVLDFVSAFPATSSQATNLLTWSFSDLAPFQSTEFLLTLNVNSPMETPAVNLGDILHYIATINTTTTDETPLDNQKELNQTVVGSFDPNDKTVVEGSQISISKIDDYLHYIIRFQNTGTYATENIVVKDIFTDKLDWSTLQMISSSHPFRSSLNGNILEVFYEGINLPPSSVDEVGSHGYISFKIKPKQTVLVDDVIDNTAGIYFDYNFPIVTNTVSTVFTSLGVSDIGKNKFTIYPNPAKSIINITSPNNEIINSISIYNVVGQKLITSINQNSIDVSSLSKGSYFITIETDKGKGILKFLKE